MALTIVAGIWLIGFAAGYGVREYISHYRRNRQRRWPSAFDQ